MLERRVYLLRIVFLSIIAVGSLAYVIIPALLLAGWFSRNPLQQLLNPDQYESARYLIARIITVFGILLVGGATWFVAFFWFVGGIAFFEAVLLKRLVDLSELKAIIGNSHWLSRLCFTDNFFQNRVSRLLE